MVLGDIDALSILRLSFLGIICHASLPLLCCGKRGVAGNGFLGVEPSGRQQRLRIDMARSRHVLVWLALVVPSEWLAVWLLVHALGGATKSFH